VKRMENLVVQRQTDEEGVTDSRRLPVMRTLARLQWCEAGAIYGSVDAREQDVERTLEEMVSRGEVEVSPQSRGSTSRPRYALTLAGWREYLRALVNVYEMPE